MTKMLSASGGRSPPDQGLCPQTPVIGWCPQPLIPSSAYDPRASSPPTYFHKFTREDDVDGRASVIKDEERVLRGGKNHCC